MIKSERTAEADSPVILESSKEGKVSPLSYSTTHKKGLTRRNISALLAHSCS